MITKIQIRTPKGVATKTEKRIRKFIIGIPRRRVSIINNYVDADDSTFIWEIDAPVRDTLRIMKNLSRFDVVMQNIFNHKLMRKVANKKLTAEDSAELKDMFLNHTSVTLIKKEQEEILIDDKTTFWQYVKKKFKKV